MTTKKPRSTPTLKRGAVVIVKYPNSDLKSVKLRPAVVIERDELQTGLTQIIVAMISSQTARAGHPSRVLIQRHTSAGRQSGLLHDSVVMTDNLTTVIAKAVSRVIGSLPRAGIDAALRHTLDL